MNNEVSKLTSARRIAQHVVRIERASTKLRKKYLLIHHSH